MIAQRRPRAQTSERRISEGPHPHELTLCENEHGAVAGINAVAALTEAPGVELIVFGGRVRHPGGAVVGRHAEQQLAYWCPLDRPQTLIVDKEARPEDLRPLPGTAVPALTGS